MTHPPHITHAPPHASAHTSDRVEVKFTPPTSDWDHVARIVDAITAADRGRVFELHIENLPPAIDENVTAAPQAEAAAIEAERAASGKRTRKPRRQSISKMIEQAEKAGKPLASITMPDGTKLDFSGLESAKPEVPWPLDEFRIKGAKR
jgi:hypothetical protein